MKIIEMERRTLDGKPVEYGIDENGEDYRDWWCVIETAEEEMVYDYVVEQRENGWAVPDLWNNMVKHAGERFGLAWGDDDIYGYIRPDEVAPLPTEPYIDADGDEWVVIQ